MAELTLIKPKNEDTPIKRTKLTDQVVDCLMNWIMDGTLKMGGRLNTVQIAEQLHVSRMPVREALNILEQRGLVVSEPNVGTRLVQLTKEDVYEIYEIRQALEPVAAYYACLKVTQDIIDELVLIHEEYQEVLQAPELNAKNVHLANCKFHFTIYHASGMKRLCQMIENLWSSTSFFKMIYGETFLKSDEGKKIMIAEHQSYIDLLKAGDADLLRDTVRRNIRDKLDRYLESGFMEMELEENG